MTDNKKNNPFKKDPSGNEPNGDFNWSKIIRTVFTWGLLFVFAVILMQWMDGDSSSYTEIDREQYNDFLRQGKIKEAKVIERDNKTYVFEGVLKEATIIRKNNRDVKVSKFQTIIFERLLEKEEAKWESAKLKYRFERESSEWLTFLVGMIPWILIIAFWVFFMRRMQGGSGGGGGSRGLFNFGKSRAKLISNTLNKVTFSDVAGADEAKIELEEVIEFLKEPKKFQRLGGKIPRGVLLLGPPGTGKTLLARAVAGEADVPFFSLSGADFVEMFVGVGASRVRDLFEQGKKNAPCIIFIDEIDAVGRHRGAGLGGGHDEREQTLNQLLVEMDGFEQNSGVILIAATNRPDVLDPALLRPGRFDRQVVVDRPDVQGREGILKVHTRKIPLAKNVDIRVLAKGTPGLSGADLANLVNEAALLAARKNKKKVHMSDFEEAKDKVMMGTERRSLIISDKEKKITAYHEIGHVLVAKMLPEADPVHKVTIIPRGRALGVTTYLPMDEKHTYSKEYLESTITYALGGRAAELLIFNQLTTGAGNDIEKATGLARKMICEWGMSEKLGPVSYGSNEEEIFLGREVTKHKDISDKTAEMIDAEVKNIVQAAMKRAEKILEENLDVLHRLSEELLEREILDGDEIDKIIKGETLPPIQKDDETKDEDIIEHKDNSADKSLSENDLPEHVKKLMELRSGKSSDDVKTQDNSKSLDESSEENDK